MANRCAFSPQMTIPGGQINKPANRASMLQSSSIIPTNRRISDTLIRSFKVNKVFEDRSRGIVCYTDDQGEVICEGYDEGPRFSQPTSRRVYRQSLADHRELQIHDFLQERRDQIAQGVDFHVAVPEGFDCNGLIGSAN